MSLFRSLALVPLMVGLLSSPALAQSASRWFLAEGASNGIFEQEILVANPGASDLKVTVTLLPDSTAVIAPGTALSKDYTLAATSRLTVRVGTDFAGLNGAASAEVKAVVANSTTPADIVVERSMYFPDGTRGGGHNASGVTQPAPRWILAEGATTTVFDTFILVANPNASSTTVRVQYLKSTGQIVEFTNTIPAGSRRTFWPAVDYPTELGDAEFSTVVESTEAGEPIVAERAMYFNAPAPGASFTRSGHDALGVPEASRTWYFAEGATGGDARVAFETFLLLANTNSTQVTATVTYQLDTGEALARDYVLQPNQRFTVWVDQEGRTWNQKLRAAAFGMSVNATAPIVAERAMYWGAPSAADASSPVFPWIEGHATAGSPDLAPKWAFAEGREGLDAGGRTYSSFFLLSNPGTSPITVRATLYSEDGGGITSTIVVPARGRANLWPTAGLAEFAALANRRFATVLESAGGETFIAERAMYWGTTNPFSSGHVNVGTPWTAAITAPSRSPSTVSVSGMTPATMRLSGGETITVTGTNFSGPPEVTVDGLPATVTGFSGTSITAVAPLRTAATGLGAVAPSTVRITTAGRTLQAGTIQRVFRVLSIGDSFTEGQLVERIPPVPPATQPTQIYSWAEPPYPEGLEALLRADPRFRSTADVDNEGASGECASIRGCSGNVTSGQSRIQGLTTAKKYDVVIILEGFNDLNAGGTLSGAIEALRFMGRTAKASGATVLMGRIHVMQSSMWDQIRTMALQEQFTRVDFGTSVEIGSDNIHPTQDGYDEMAWIAYNAIKTVIK